MRCDECRFYSYKHAQCRRRSPMPAGFPEVERDDWCGEFDGDIDHLRNIEIIANPAVVLYGAKVASVGDKLQLMQTSLDKAEAAVALRVSR